VTSPGFPELEFFRTRTPSPFTMVCFKGDYVCADIKNAGFRKEWSEGLGLLIMDLDPATDFFVDFGANTGFFGLAAAARGVATLAVEPAQAAICRLNAAINGFSPSLYDFHGLALVQSPGAGPMKQIVPWQNMGGSTLVEASKTTSWTTLFSEELAHMDITVPTSTIDEVVRARVLAPRRAVKLLKIDVEGFEVFAWRGGEQLLASGLVYQIVAEWHPRFLVSSGVQPSEYLRIMIRCIENCAPSFPAPGCRSASFPLRTLSQKWLLRVHWNRGRRPH
jgi:FkbM family methyltransferase